MRCYLAKHQNNVKRVEPSGWDALVAGRDDHLTPPEEMTT
jgi:hypothetical protein